MTRQEGRGVVSIPVLATLLLCSTATGAAPAESTANPWIDYVAKLNELIPRGQDESLNAEPFYRKAFEQCVELPDIVGSEVIRWPAELPAERRAVLEKWVAANSDALTQLRLGTQKPAYWFRYQGRDVWDVGTVDHLRTTRMLCWALLLHTKFEAVKGNVKGAADDLAVCYRFVADMKKRPILAEQLAGVGMWGYAQNATFQVLEKTCVDVASLEFLQHRLTELTTDPTWLIDLRPEELVALGSIQQVYAKWNSSLKGMKPEAMGAMERQAVAWVAAQLSAQLGRDLTAEQLCSLVGDYEPKELAELVRKAYPYYNSLVAKTPLQWRREASDFHKDIQELTRGNLLLDILVPAVPELSALSFRGRAGMEAMITTLALLRYRNDKGSYPDDLQELVATGYVSHVPLDPYSDGPLVYKRTESSFMLYSLGADFDDDGGRHDPQWGKGEQGGDYVFWPVQPAPTAAD
jgi:hypothetical protein